MDTLRKLKIFIVIDPQGDPYSGDVLLHRHVGIQQVGSDYFSVGPYVYIEDQSMDIELKRKLE